MGDGKVGCWADDLGVKKVDLWGIEKVERSVAWKECLSAVHSGIVKGDWRVA